MIAFGGAAPLHAGRLCEKLGVDRLLVPPGAGVGSAIGFLRAPFSFEATRSVFMRLNEFDGDVVKKLLAELKEEATGFVRTCAPKEPITAKYKVYMRYSGQGWEIPIELSDSDAAHPDADTFKRLFEQDYVALFGRTVAGLEAEITVWAANATTAAQPAGSLEPFKKTVPVSASDSREVFDPAIGERVNAGVVLRDQLSTGDSIAGPAVITESQTTIIVPSSRSAVRQSDGCIDMVSAGDSL